MAKRILVPLDKTIAAESVVDAVADMARGGGATLRLLHVAPVPDNVVSDERVVAYADQEAARLESEGLDYLAAVVARMGCGPVDCVVRVGQPVKECILACVEFCD